MDIKQELLKKINRHDQDGTGIVLTPEQSEYLLQVINDSVNKDNIIEDLQSRLQAKDDTIGKLTAAIAIDFIKRNG